MPNESEADAELLRMVLSTAAHDLGGLSSALALRTDVLAPSLPVEDAAALRALVDEARTLGRQLRRLRGPAGGSQLAPTRERSLAEWIALIERFGRPALGRGIELRCAVGEGALSPEAEHALTYALLALFRGLHEARGEQTLLVEVRGESNGGAIDLTVSVQWSAASPPGLSGDRWFQHARTLSTSHGMTWDLGDLVGNLEVRIRGSA